jgi:hypothetical protein
MNPSSSLNRPQNGRAPTRETRKMPPPNIRVSSSSVSHSHPARFPVATRATRISLAGSKKPPASTQLRAVHPPSLPQVAMQLFNTDTAPKPVCFLTQRRGGIITVLPTNAMRFQMHGGFRNWLLRDGVSDKISDAAWKRQLRRHAEDTGMRKGDGSCSC